VTILLDPEAYATLASDPPATDDTTTDAITVSGRYVVFEARTDDPALGDDLERDDDEIADATWFDAVSAEYKHRPLLTRYR
jgi:hypothetical protein